MKKTHYGDTEASLKRIEVLALGVRIFAFVKGFCVFGVGVVLLLEVVVGVKSLRATTTSFQGWLQVGLVCCVAPRVVRYRDQCCLPTTSKLRFWIFH